MYLNRNKVLSYNCALNFIVLKRGYGKSWTFKDLLITQFLKDGSKAVWLRRYKPELRKSISKFLPDILDRYPDHKLEIKNKVLYIDGKEAVNFYTLSEAQDLKSMSFAGYKYLVFDEFIIEGKAKHYIGDECDLFASFMSTMFRDRPMKVFLLGNKVKRITPYNIYFNLPEFDGIVNNTETSTLVYARDNDDVVEDNYIKSDLAKVLKNTKYYEYAFMNNSLTDTMQFIEKRPKECTSNTIITVDGVPIGVYFYTKKSKIYFDRKCDTTVKYKYVLNRQNLAESFLLLAKNSPIYKLLREAYHNGRIYYCDSKTKGICEKLVEFLE